MAESTRSFRGRGDKTPFSKETNMIKNPGKCPNFRSYVIRFTLIFLAAFSAFPQTMERALTLDQAIAAAAGALTEQMSPGSVMGR
jgi:hypothetical protein